MHNAPIIVVGAGIGGLSASIHLAAAGARVVVLEQHDVPGGKMSEVRADGFRWDTGPSVITMRNVLADTFSAAGQRLEDYLELLPVEPLTRYFYPDGARIDASRDLARMAEQIAQINPRDVEGYLAYLAYAARIHRITGNAFIYSDPPTMGKLMRTPLRDMPAVDPLRTMAGAISGFVRSPHLRQLLMRFATYVGASPYLAPATLNVIAHIELTGGVWYPRGGIYAITRAFRRLAEELGVEIRTDSRVEQITARDKTITGVTLANGDHIAADTVIANVDVATVYERLLPRGEFDPARLKRLLRVEPSCSGFILLLGVEGAHHDLAHHNIFFSRDYAAEFDAIFARGLPPTDPTIYVAITSKTDTDDAPAGCENWFVLINAPPISSAYDWSASARTYRDLVLARLAERGYDLRGKIRVERMMTPADIERLTGARRGALYGASSNDRLNALRRPHNRARDVRGLYFAGGTAHPGGGVPMVTLSGRAAARMALADRA